MHLPRRHTHADTQRQAHAKTLGGGDFPWRNQLPSPQFAKAKPFPAPLICIGTSPLGGDVFV